MSSFRDLEEGSWSLKVREKQSRLKSNETYLDKIMLETWNAFYRSRKSKIKKPCFCIDLKKRELCENLWLPMDEHCLLTTDKRMMARIIENSFYCMANGCSNRLGVRGNFNGKAPTWCPKRKEAEHE